MLAPDRALCHECPRLDSKPENLLISEFKRPHAAPIDLETCLLAQGFLCLGPATRSGCGAPCVKGNMPCTGCLGPTSHVMDFGLSSISALASSISGQDEKEIDAILDNIVDPVGTFNRYSLPSTLLHRYAGV